ncbi:MAG: preprotein translocase subunit SecE [bacterium]
MIGRTKRYIKEVIVEMKKVTWPSRYEVIGSTIVVIVVSLFFAMLVGAFDRLMERILFFIIGK